MKVAGFTIIRNAIKYDFQVVESIMSILPICDEFVVAVGKSDDATLDLIKSIDSDKIRIIETVWDDSLKAQNGRVYALETDKAFKAISPEMDWAFYVQSDEAVHEKYLPVIKEAMQRWKDDDKTEGLLFNYKHFFGSYQYYGAAYAWYRKEIRIVKNKSNIYSYKDAQSFRKNDNEKLHVRLMDAEMYHYGYVREPQKFVEKINYQKAMYHENAVKIQEYNYMDEVDALYEFEGTHPALLAERIKKINWEFTHDVRLNKMKTKDKFKHFIEKYTGYIIGEFKNYKLLK